MRIRRPAGINIILCIIFIISAWNILRLVTVTEFRTVLGEYGISDLTAYLSLSAIIWLATGVVLFIGIAKRKSWAWEGTLAYSIAQAGWYWLDRLIVREYNGNWIFALGTTLIFLTLMAMLLFTRKTKIFFRSEGNDD